jgi:uncharacterized repeat protein (TIGR03803 family)
MKIIFALFFVSALLVISVQGQGSFQNLDFEAATISQTQSPGMVNTTDALPNWNVYYGSNQQTQMVFNAVTSGVPQVVLLGTNGISQTNIEGGFSVFLQGIAATLPGGRVIATDVSINQTGAVPATAQSILFKAQRGTATLSVSLGGQNVPFMALSNGVNYTLYGGDVSTFTNQDLQLEFTVSSTSSNQTGWNLDSIEFSDQSILPTPPQPVIWTNYAGIFANLYSFPAGGNNGTDPEAKLILSGNTLYGATAHGGVSNVGYGTLFKINTDGTGFTNLYIFTNGTDGANPMGGLTISGHVLYGTASEGGGSNGAGSGTVFKINTDGTGFTNLYNFTNMNDGDYPVADLLLSGNVLYGTTTGGGDGSGNIFRINTDGTGFTNLYSFNSNGDDGAYLVANLILSNGTLYGTTSEGGFDGFGNIFKVNTNGTGFEILHDFMNSPNDGGFPEAGLVLSGNVLYGTTEIGGTPGYGTVFKVNTDGTDFTNLYSFSNGSDGAFVESGLVLSGNTLYGTTSEGSGSAGYGTVFRIDTDGTGFTNLYNFTLLSPAYTNSDGALPDAALVLSGDTLYGTAAAGGIYGNGTVFAVSLGPILLNIQTSGSNMILTWGNPAFSLQTAPTASGIYTNMPGAASPYTNTITGSQMFFRLQANSP